MTWRLAFSLVGCIGVAYGWAALCCMRAAADGDADMSAVFAEHQRQQLAKRVTIWKTNNPAEAGEPNVNWRVTMFDGMPISVGLELNEIADRILSHEE